jgi:DNA-binding MarR family transcriptional regulator/predicted N-acetyltransferase YhbS
MADAVFAARVAKLRRFNRFYTQQIGVLEERLLDSSFSLTEARVLYELAHAEKQSAADLARRLGLDPGYLSRILRGFERRGLLRREPSAEDRRAAVISLTAAGRAAFCALDMRSQAATGALLQGLPEDRQARLVAAARTIEEELDPFAATRADYGLRRHRPGDIGWIISRHGALYAQEYGWSLEFEALVAEIGAKFLRGFDPSRELCLIAERDGENLGSAMVVAGDEVGTAKLRLLLVEPRARGAGVGSRLVCECVSFARAAGYQKLTLWTNSILTAARRLYQRAGFRLVSSEAHHSFGRDLVSETWELVLPAVG